MKVLFVSGYTEDVALKDGVAGGVAFLQKPFTPEALGEHVASLLKQRPSRPN